MATRALIGVNAELQRNVTLAKTDYCDSVFAAGGIPVILAPISDDTYLEENLDRLDGVLFVGSCKDLDPRRDGFMLHPKVQLMEPRRESFDRMLMRHCMARRVPVLGIGAGMQLLNLIAGGTLSLDIREDFPKALPHFDPIDRFEHGHALDIEPGSFMDLVFRGAEIARVNSNHHMCVDDVAPGFSATARSPDGIIEAIESQSDWFAIGTQFHPESRDRAIAP